MFGPENWVKYFEIKSSLDDFELYNTLAKKVGCDITFRNQNDIRIIEASNIEQSRKLEEIVGAEDPSFPIRKNETLNVCQGTIVIPNDTFIGNKEFSECSGKIKENLEMQGFEIKTVTTYTRPPRSNRKYPLRIAKITFEGRALPNTVVIGGQRLSVREYFPAPYQCNKCWKFGHGIKYCQSNQFVCPICGLQGHQKIECTETTLRLCKNCQGNHPAFSKSCPMYKIEQLIAKTRFKEGLSYQAAKNKLKQNGEMLSNNYRKALDNKITPSMSTPKVFKTRTSNKFSALELDDGDIQAPSESQYNISTKSVGLQDQKISKRIRNNSSEDEGENSKFNQNRNREP